MPPLLHALIGSLLVSAADASTVVDGGVTVDWATAKYRTAGRGDAMAARRPTRPRPAPRRRAGRLRHAHPRGALLRDGSVLGAGTAALRGRLRALAPRPARRLRPLRRLGFAAVRQGGRDRNPRLRWPAAGSPGYCGRSGTSGPPTTSAYAGASPSRPARGGRCRATSSATTRGWSSAASGATARAQMTLGSTPEAGLLGHR